MSGVPLSGTHAFTLWQGQKETTDIELNDVTRLPSDAPGHPSNGGLFHYAPMSLGIHYRLFGVTLSLRRPSLLPDGGNEDASVDW